MYVYKMFDYTFVSKNWNDDSSSRNERKIKKIKKCYSKFCSLNFFLWNNWKFTKISLDTSKLSYKNECEAVRTARKFKLHSSFL